MKRICFVEKIDPEKEERKIRRKEWFEQKWKGVKEFYYDHKDEIIIFGPFVIGTLGKILKITGKQLKHRNEKQLKELYCYDRSLGHYWKLRRELSNDEWVEIDKRKNNGERLADILDELKVLK